MFENDFKFNAGDGGLCRLGLCVHELKEGIEDASRVTFAERPRVSLSIPPIVVLEADSNSL